MLFGKFCIEFGSVQMDTKNIVRSLFGLSICKTGRPGQKITAFGCCTLFAD